MERRKRFIMGSKNRMWILLVVAVMTGACIFLPQDLIPSQATGPDNECVILLHGLGRSARSMTKVEDHLRAKGYDVYNLDYASMSKSIKDIAATDLAETVAIYRDRGYRRIHFVTHSLGGIVVRYYLQENRLPLGSRIVMLGPPNQGCELVDMARKHSTLFDRLAGPAATQLGTGEHTLLTGLKPVLSEVGIIIGNRSWNPILSMILPGQDDGKVSVSRARLAEMNDFLVLPTTHMTIMRNTEALDQIAFFLKNGYFFSGI